MNFGAALLGGLAIYFFKPLVLLFIVILLVRFWRLKITGARWIWAGIWCFFIAEGLCAVETYLLHHINITFDIIHNLSSAAAVGLITMGLFLFFDKYYLHYVDESKPCFVVRFCGDCPKRSNNKCKFHSIVIWSAVFLLLIAMAPLFSEVRELHANPLDHKLPWESLNRFYDNTIVPLFDNYLGGYSQAELCLVMPKESIFVAKRVLPFIALLAMFIGLILLIARRNYLWIAFLFSIGIGAMGFSYYHTVLYEVNPYIYWGSLGEEITELIGLFMLIGFWKLMKDKPLDNKES